jgi:hypothetical protein
MMNVINRLLQKCEGERAHQFSMFGDDRQRSGRDGIRVKTLEKQVYRTRIGLQMMVANDAEDRGQPDILAVTLGVTPSALFELPPRFAFDAKNR